MSCLVVPLCRILQDALGRPADLLGDAVVLVPVNLLRSKGAAPVPVRMLLGHGDGSIAFKLSAGVAASTTEAVAKAVDDSASPNKIGAGPAWLLSICFSHVCHAPGGLPCSVHFCSGNREHARTAVPRPPSLTAGGRERV